ncbi:MAG TPA: hypothetical protein VFH51_03830 [Myxococcota bacterium]|nr:hypothetical protein [Myxococcota bacterium]
MTPSPSSSNPQAAGAARHHLSRPTDASTQAGDLARRGAKSLVQLALEQVHRVPLFEVAAFAVEHDVPSYLVPRIVSLAAQTSMALQPPRANQGGRNRTFTRVPPLLRSIQDPCLLACLLGDLETARAGIATSADRAAMLSAAIGRIRELRTLLQGSMRDSGVHLPAVADRAQAWLDAIDGQQLQWVVQLCRHSEQTNLLTRVNEDAVRRDRRNARARQGAEALRIRLGSQDGVASIHDTDSGCGHCVSCIDSTPATHGD